MQFNVIYKDQPTYLLVSEKEALELSMKKLEFKCFQYEHEHKKENGFLPTTYIRMVNFENKQPIFGEWHK